MSERAGKLPIFECVRDAWLFLIGNWRLFLPAAAVTALISEVVPTIRLALAAPSAMPQSALSAGLGELATLIPAMLAGLMFSAAVLRKAVRNEFYGATGLGVGADELRLAAVMAALLCIVVPLGMLLYLVVWLLVLSRIAASPEALQQLMADPEAFNLALETALGPSGTAAFLLLITAMLGAIIYAVTRLFMINAATIGERRIVVFQTWSWSRGNIFRMFAAAMLTWLPAYLADSVLYEIGLRVLNAVATDQNAGLTIPVFKIIVTFVAAVLSIPSLALAAIFYKGLRPADFVAK